MKNWFVLMSEGGFVGQNWQIINGSKCHPRLAVGPLIDCAVYSSLASAKEDARRVLAILGVRCRPVPIEFVEQGKKARVRLITEKTRPND